MPDKLNSQEINEPPDESQDGKEITENLSDFSQNETTFLPHAQRAQLRAAINSVYNTRPYAENLLEPIVSPELPPEEPAPQFEELDIEIKEISEAELLMERAEILIRSGKQEQARQIYSRAVRIAPDNADAWT